MPLSERALHFIQKRNSHSQKYPEKSPFFTLWGQELLETDTHSSFEITKTRLDQLRKPNPSSFKLPSHLESQMPLSS